MKVVLMKNEIHDSAYERQLLLHGLEIPMSKHSSLAGHARQPCPHLEEITAYTADGDKQQQKARGGRMAGSCSCTSMKAQGFMCEDLGGCIFLCKNYSILTGQN